MPQRNHPARPRTRTLGLALVALAALLLGVSAALAGVEAAQLGSYELLAQTAAGTVTGTVTDTDATATAAAADADAAAGSDAATESQSDWDALVQENAETVAWLCVAGTPIDYPVVQPGDGTAASYYLHHDFWGAYSALGCPYLDARAQAAGSHLLVYGHHLSSSDAMFTSIFRAYQQEIFDAVGAATWTTPDGATVFEPVFALSVDQGYAAIQTFDFASEEALRAWLLALAGDATASAADWEERCAGATRVLTLVTCSSTHAGQRARTLLVFVA